MEDQYKLHKKVKKIILKNNHSFAWKLHAGRVMFSHKTVIIMGFVFKKSK